MPFVHLRVLMPSLIISMLLAQAGVAIAAAGPEDLTGDWLLTVIGSPCGLTLKRGASVKEEKGQRLFSGMCDVEARDGKKYPQEHILWVDQGTLRLVANKGFVACEAPFKKEEAMEGSCAFMGARQGVFRAERQKK